jgi:plasmid stabilization system protein ParE
MWDTISRAELEATKKQLRTRRQELIRRHAEELQAIEQDQAEIEAFDQLIGTIADKFKIGRSRRNELVGGETGLQTEDIEGVPFLITQAQKSRLRELGIDDDQIRDMKPKEAHRILGIAS